LRQCHGSRASGEKRRRAKQAAAALGGTVSFTASAGAPDAVTRLIKRIGARARFAFPVHAHMLRHACGYALANAGRHPSHPRLARPPIDPAHDALHAIERGAVQGLLEVANKHPGGLRSKFKLRED
jgi:integrase